MVVVHAGQAVESGPVETLRRHPQHPYTRRLIEATPDLDGRREVTSIPGRPRATGRDFPDATTDPPILDVRDLVVRYPRRRGVVAALRRRPAESVRAVDGVSLRVNAGELVALVGESGCGKTSTALATLRIIEPAAGSIRIDGEEIVDLTPRMLRARRPHAQLIYQDPYQALDPRYRVRATVDAPARRDRRQPGARPPVADRRRTRLDARRRHQGCGAVDPR